MPVSHVTLDSLVTSLDSPLVIVTARGRAEDVGCLVGFHAQSSIDPLRWTLWISTLNHSHDAITAADVVAVHFLTATDLELAELFGGETGDEVDKFSRCDVGRRHEGAPVLAGVANVMVGRRTASLDAGGDHTCVVIDPIDVTASGFVPLRFRQVADLRPGHPRS